MAKGEDILTVAESHIGEKYVLGSIAPKNNPNWKGPWDCAEFASWCVFQVSDILYGCRGGKGNLAKADAYTGYWREDAGQLGKKISIEEAARTPGAAVLRYP